MPAIMAPYIAISAYEKQMRARGAKEAQDSLEMMEWMHAEGAVNKMAQLMGLAG